MDAYHTLSRERLLEILGPVTLYDRYFDAAGTVVEVGSRPFEGPVDLGSATLALLLRLWRRLRGLFSLPGGDRSRVQRRRTRGLGVVPGALEEVPWAVLVNVPHAPILRCLGPGASGGLGVAGSENVDKARQVEWVFGRACGTTGAGTVSSPRVGRVPRWKNQMTTFTYQPLVHCTEPLDGFPASQSLDSGDSGSGKARAGPVPLGERRERYWAYLNRLVQPGRGPEVIPDKQGIVLPRGSWYPVSRAGSGHGHRTWVATLVEKHVQVGTIDPWPGGYRLPHVRGLPLPLPPQIVVGTVNWARFLLHTVDSLVASQQGDLGLKLVRRGFLGGLRQCMAQLSAGPEASWIRIHPVLSGPGDMARQRLQEAALELMDRLPLLGARDLDVLNFGRQLDDLAPAWQYATNLGHLRVSAHRFLQSLDSTEHDVTMTPRRFFLLRGLEEQLLRHCAASLCLAPLGLVQGLGRSVLRRGPTRGTPSAPSRSGSGPPSVSHPGALPYPQSSTSPVPLRSGSRGGGGALGAWAQDASCLVVEFGETRELVLTSLGYLDPVSSLILQVLLPAYHSLGVVQRLERATTPVGGASMDGAAALSPRPGGGRARETPSQDGSQTRQVLLSPDLVSQASPVGTPGTGDGVTPDSSRSLFRAPRSVHQSRTLMQALRLMREFGGPGLDNPFLAMVLLDMKAPLAVVPSPCGVQYLSFGMPSLHLLGEAPGAPWNVGGTLAGSERLSQGITGLGLQSTESLLTPGFLSGLGGAKQEVIPVGGPVAEPLPIQTVPLLIQTEQARVQAHEAALWAGSSSRSVLSSGVATRGSSVPSVSSGVASDERSLQISLVRSLCRARSRAGLDSGPTGAVSETGPRPDKGPGGGQQGRGSRGARSVVRTEKKLALGSGDEDSDSSGGFSSRDSSERPAGAPGAGPTTPATRTRGIGGGTSEGEDGGEAHPPTWPRDEASWFCAHPALTAIPYETFSLVHPVAQAAQALCDLYLLRQYISPITYEPFTVSSQAATVVDALDQVISGPDLSLVLFHSLPAALRPKCGVVAAYQRGAWTSLGEDVGPSQHYIRYTAWLAALDLELSGELRPGPKGGKRLLASSSVLTARGPQPGPNELYKQIQRGLQPTGAVLGKLPRTTLEELRRQLERQEQATLNLNRLPRPAVDPLGDSLLYYHAHFRMYVLLLLYQLIPEEHGLKVRVGYVLVHFTLNEVGNAQLTERLLEEVFGLLDRHGDPRGVHKALGESLGLETYRVPGRYTGRGTYLGASELGDARRVDLVEQAVYGRGGTGDGSCEGAAAGEVSGRGGGGLAVVSPRGGWAVQARRLGTQCAGEVPRGLVATDALYRTATPLAVQSLCGALLLDYGTLLLNRHDRKSTVEALTVFDACVGNHLENRSTRYLQWLGWVGRQATQAGKSNRALLCLLHLLDQLGRLAQPRQDEVWCAAEEGRGPALVRRVSKARGDMFLVLQQISGLYLGQGNWWMAELFTKLALQPYAAAAATICPPPLHPNMQKLAVITWPRGQQLYAGLWRTQLPRSLREFVALKPRVEARASLRRPQSAQHLRARGRGGSASAIMGKGSASKPKTSQRVRGVSADRDQSGVGAGAPSESGSVLDDLLEDDGSMGPPMPSTLQGWVGGSSVAARLFCQAATAGAGEHTIWQARAKDLPVLLQSEVRRVSLEGCLSLPFTGKQDLTPLPNVVYGDSLVIKDLSFTAQQALEYQPYALYNHRTSEGRDVSLLPGHFASANRYLPSGKTMGRALGLGQGGRVISGGEARGETRKILRGGVCFGNLGYSDPRFFELVFPSVGSRSWAAAVWSGAAGRAGTLLGLSSGRSSRRRMREQRQSAHLGGSTNRPKDARASPGMEGWLGLGTVGTHAAQCLVKASLALLGSGQSDPTGQAQRSKLGLVALQWQFSALPYHAPLISWLLHGVKCSPTLERVPRPAGYRAKASGGAQSFARPNRSVLVHGVPVAGDLLKPLVDRLPLDAHIAAWGPSPPLLVHFQGAGLGSDYLDPQLLQIVPVLSQVYRASGRPHLVLSLLEHVLMKPLPTPNLVQFGLHYSEVLRSCGLYYRAAMVLRSLQERLPALSGAYRHAIWRTVEHYRTLRRGLDGGLVRVAGEPALGVNAPASPGPSAPNEPEPEPGSSTESGTERGPVPVLHSERPRLELNPGLRNLLRFAIQACELCSQTYQPGNALFWNDLVLEVCGTNNLSFLARVYGQRGRIFARLLGSGYRHFLLYPLRLLPSWRYDGLAPFRYLWVGPLASSSTPYTPGRCGVGGRGGVVGSPRVPGAWTEDHGAVRLKPSSRRPGVGATACDPHAGAGGQEGRPSSDRAAEIVQLELLEMGRRVRRAVHPALQPIPRPTLLWCSWCGPSGGCVYRSGTELLYDAQLSFELAYGFAVSVGDVYTAGKYLVEYLLVLLDLVVPLCLGGRVGLGRVLRQLQPRPPAFPVPVPESPHTFPDLDTISGVEASCQRVLKQALASSNMVQALQAYVVLAETELCWGRSSVAEQYWLGCWDLLAALFTVDNRSLLFSAQRFPSVFRKVRGVLKRLMRVLLYLPVEFIGDQLGVVELYLETEREAQQQEQYGHLFGPGLEGGVPAVLSRKPSGLETERSSGGAAPAGKPDSVSLVVDQHALGRRVQRDPLSVLLEPGEDGRDGLNGEDVLGRGTLGSAVAAPGGAARLVSAFPPGPGPVAPVVHDVVYDLVGPAPGVELSGSKVSRGMASVSASAVLVEERMNEAVKASREAVTGQPRHLTWTTVSSGPGPKGGPGGVRSWGGGLTTRGRTGGGESEDLGLPRLPWLPFLFRMRQATATNLRQYLQGCLGLCFDGTTIPDVATVASSYLHRIRTGLQHLEAGHGRVGVVREANRAAVRAWNAVLVSSRRAQSGHGRAFPLSRYRDRVRHFRALERLIVALNVDGLVALWTPGTGRRTLYHSHHQLCEPHPSSRFSSQVVSGVVRQILGQLSLCEPQTMDDGFTGALGGLCQLALYLAVQVQPALRIWLSLPDVTGHPVSTLPDLARAYKLGGTGGRTSRRGRDRINHKQVWGRTPIHVTPALLTAVFSWSGARAARQLQHDSGEAWTGAFLRRAGGSGRSVGQPGGVVSGPDRGEGVGQGESPEPSEGGKHTTRKRREAVGDHGMETPLSYATAHLHPSGKMLQRVRGRGHEVQLTLTQAGRLPSGWPEVEHPFASHLMTGLFCSPPMTCGVALGFSGSHPAVVSETVGKDSGALDEAGIFSMGVSGLVPGVPARSRKPVRGTEKGGGGAPTPVASLGTRQISYASAPARNLREHVYLWATLPAAQAYAGLPRFELPGLVWRWISLMLGPADAKSLSNPELQFEVNGLVSSWLGGLGELVPPPGPCSLGYGLTSSWLRAVRARTKSSETGKPGEGPESRSQVRGESPAPRGQSPVGLRLNPVPRGEGTPLGESVGARRRSRNVGVVVGGPATRASSVRRGDRGPEQRLGLAPLFDPSSVSLPPPPARTSLDDPALWPKQQVPTHAQLAEMGRVQQSDRRRQVLGLNEMYVSGLLLLTSLPLRPLVWRGRVYPLSVTGRELVGQLVQMNDMQRWSRKEALYFGRRLLHRAQLFRHATHPSRVLSDSDEPYQQNRSRGWIQFMLNMYSQDMGRHEEVVFGLSGGPVSQPPGQHDVFLAWPSEPAFASHLAPSLQAFLHRKHSKLAGSRRSRRSSGSVMKSRRMGDAEESGGVEEWTGPVYGGGVWVEAALRIITQPALTLPHPVFLAQVPGAPFLGTAPSLPVAAVAQPVVLRTSPALTFLPWELALGETVVRVSSTLHLHPLCPSPDPHHTLVTVLPYLRSNSVEALVGTSRTQPLCTVEQTLSSLGCAPFVPYYDSMSRQPTLAHSPYFHHPGRPRSHVLPPNCVAVDASGGSSMPQFFGSTLHQLRHTKYPGSEGVVVCLVLPLSDLASMSPLLDYLLTPGNYQPVSFLFVPASFVNLAVDLVCKRVRELGRAQSGARWKRLPARASYQVLVRVQRQLVAEKRVLAILLNPPIFMCTP